MAGVKDLGLFALHRLEDDIIGLYSMHAAFLSHDANIRHQVPEIPLREDAGVADGHYPVFHHVAAVAEHGGERMISLDVDAGDDLVDGLFAEEVRPLLQPVLIQTLDVAVEQLLGLEA